MNIVLTNPAGFFALLGIPAVILIHFLQRQARVIPISTLFLLAHTQRESLSGRRFDRFTNSVPLWLQLLMVLLLTWLLVLPRYVRPASTQQVAIVLDSSASMSVFKDKLVISLREKLPPLQGNASRLQLYLFESAAEKPVIYAGNDLEEALTSLEDWNPSAGSTDPDNSLRLARSRVSREGILVYVSDTPGADLPFNAQSLSIGEPRTNVGFTGVAFENEGATVRWNALLRNYSDSPQTRSWQVVFADGSRSQPQPVTLEKNSMTSISSAFPSGSKSLRVVLTPDDFSLDDELPLVLPRPKSLKYYLQVSEKHGNIARKFGRFRKLEEVSDPIQADLSLVSYDPLLPALPGGNSIVMVDETTQSRKYLRGGIVAEKHPLMDGINWQSLLVRESIQIQLNKTDEVLLWQGNRPLIALRTSILPEAPEGAEPRRVRQLIFNFDLTLSNAEQLESTALLLHRFSQELRNRKVALEVLNTEAGQPLRIATRSSARAAPLSLTRFGADGRALEDGTEVIALTQARFLQAPAQPGFFEIRQGDELLLESGCHFADTREADLRGCQSDDQIAGLSGKTVERNTREDHLWRLWVIIVLISLLLAWHFTRDRPRDEEEHPADPLPVTSSR